MAREGLSTPAMSASSPAWMSLSDPTCLSNALSRAMWLSCLRASSRVMGVSLAGIWRKKARTVADMAAPCFSSSRPY